MSVTIGGSQAAAACGIDPYKSRVQLWAELTGKLEPHEAGEPALWGQLLEPVVRVETQRRMGVQIFDSLDIWKNLSNVPKWMRGTLDGIAIKDGGRDKGVYEGKTCGPYVRGWDDGAAPPAYIIQLHHYLILTGLQWGLLACLVAGQKLELREIERDEALCQLILELEGEFVEHVENDTPPPPDGSTATTEVLKRLYAEANPGEIVNLTSEDAAKVTELRKVKRSVKLAEEEQARIENELKLRLGNATVGLYEGQKLVTWNEIVAQVKPVEAHERRYRRFMIHGN